MATARFECTAGFGTWGQIRDAVRRLKFEGHEIEMFESRGWIERTFAFRGSDQAIRLLRAYIARMAAELEAQP